ncbi:MAG TPA: ATP-binding cassette domain-containing protein [Xanthobacteraceae bacterium]|nr:ATP-binding cassette domain-containing protein [Xanthobacteraceae bacterium]
MKPGEAATSSGERILLQAAGLTKRYGGIVAIDRVDLTLRSGEVCGIIGPNGAGKSTLVGLLGGALNPTAGRIYFNGSEVTSLPASERARRGIGRTYQIPRPFLDMTVEENLLVAQYSLSPLVGTRAADAQCQSVLERTGLADAAKTPARALPLLRRKRLEVARALALRPKLLLLDEVGAGLVDAELSELIGLIHSLVEEIPAIVIVEHVIRVVRECCQRLIVLNFGRPLAEGLTSQVLESDEVAAVYLGTGHGSLKADAIPAAATASAAVAPSGQSAATLARRAGAGQAAAGGAARPLLRLEAISAAYGQAKALNDIDLAVEAGQAVAILGSNGAGKTTLAKVISGAIRPSSGSMMLDGEDVTGRSAHALAARGIAHCMEGRRIFQPLSVEENLLIAARGVSRIEQRRRLEEMYLLFPALADRRAASGTAISGGQQQMLAIARALMAKPRLVIFDEISLGLSPIVVDRLYQALSELRAGGLTMLIVEQDMDRALDLVDSVHVLEHGSIALSGSPLQIKANPRLRHLYIGAAD